MVIGVPKEIKTLENRVALTPGGVESLVRRGHTVLVERGAGEGSGLSDAEYARAGAELVGREEAFGRPQVVLGQSGGVGVVFQEDGPPRGLLQDPADGEVLDPRDVGGEADHPAAEVQGAGRPQADGLPPDPRLPLRPLRGLGQGLGHPLPALLGRGDDHLGEEPLSVKDAGGDLGAAQVQAHHLHGTSSRKRASASPRTSSGTYRATSPM